MMRRPDLRDDSISHVLCRVIRNYFCIFFASSNEGREKKQRTVEIFSRTRVMSHRQKKLIFVPHDDDDEDYILWSNRNALKSMRSTIA